MTQKDVEILGYYTNKFRNTVTLEVQLRNIPDAEDRIISIGFSKPLILWMLQELDKEEESEEEVVE